MNIKDELLKYQRKIHELILKEYPDCECWAIEATKLNEKSFMFNVYIDKEITSEKIITFHPNENTATVFISMDDMYKFLDSLEYEYQIINF